MAQPVAEPRAKCVRAAIVGFCLFLGIAPAYARPVSYTGGWTLIEETDRQATSLWLHYTTSPRWSVGARLEWDRRQDFVFAGAQVTGLAKRWFGENYQANLYAIAGAGVAGPVGRQSNTTGAADTAPAAFVGMLADWETRRFFVSYRNRYLVGETLRQPAGPGADEPSSNGQFFQAARFGAAPYVGDTGDLHTWVMVEIDHRPRNDEPVGVTPLVRFFKGAALLELGWSITDGQPLANLTYRF
ncbi:MAG: hypothetical protein AAFR20_02850 [Pseudomonadota bacterium]